MNNKYEAIMDEYRKALKVFEALTDIDAHEMKLTSKANSTIINEGIYLMFKDGASLADKYLNENKENLTLLKENIQSLEGKILHKYEDNPEAKEKKAYPIGSAHDVLEDAQVAFYKGAEYRMKNSYKDIRRNDFLTIIAKEKKYI